MQCRFQQFNCRLYWICRNIATVTSKYYSYDFFKAHCLFTCKMHSNATEVISQVVNCNTMQTIPNFFLSIFHTIILNKLFVVEINCVCNIFSHCDKAENAYDILLNNVPTLHFLENSLFGYKKYAIVYNINATSIFSTVSKYLF